jgi:hypothetical protein
MSAFERPLYGFLDKKLEERGGDKKSIDLHYGVLGKKKDPNKTIVDDPEAGMVWADAECPEAIRKELRLTPIKERLERGEQLGFAHIQEGTDKYYIKPALPGF